MPKLLPSIGAILATLGLVGCSFLNLRPTPTPETPSTPTTSNLPKLTGEWQIRLAQTGGFVGVSRTLEISSNGAMSVVDERTQQRNSLQLAPDQIIQLKEIVASTRYHPNPKPMHCEDCFNYDLQIDNGREKFQIQIDEVNLPDSGLESLIRVLDKLLNNQLKSI